METQIHLVKVYTGMQSFTLPDKSAGLVVEGTGAGNVPDEVAHQLQTLKIPIVIVSRCAKGFLSPTYGSDGGGNALKKMGCILGMGLNAQKARILLMVALGSGLQAREQLVALFEHNEMN
jgi:L-asparaginase